MISMMFYVNGEQNNLATPSKNAFAFGGFRDLSDLTAR